MASEAPERSFEPNNLKYCDTIQSKIGSRGEIMDKWLIVQTFLKQHKELINAGLPRTVTPKE